MSGKKKSIKKHFEDPKVGLSGVEATHKKLKEKGKDVSREEVKEALNELESYTLNKPVKKNFATKKVIVYDVDDQWQADLVEMDVPQGAPASENDGVRYLITVIDIFSKYAWVRPLKNKDARSVVSAFKDILKEGRVPDKLQTDDGKEFFNKLFKDLMQKNDIEHFSTKGGKKASVVERFNRTLKMKMSKFFDVTQTFRYIDNLKDFVENYNNSYHRTIKMKPIEASKEENREKVFELLFDGISMGTPKYEVGDLVRIPIQKTPFTKEIVGNWTIEIFEITDVHKLSPVTYNIKDLKGEKIEGIFYEPELQKVPKSVLDEAFRIEKVVSTRKRKGKKEAFVKYLGWPEKFNEWIPHENIK